MLSCVLGAVRKTEGLSFFVEILIAEMALLALIIIGDIETL